MISLYKCIMWNYYHYFTFGTKICILMLCLCNNKYTSFVPKIQWKQYLLISSQKPARFNKALHSFIISVQHITLWRTLKDKWMLRNVVHFRSKLKLLHCVGITRKYLKRLFPIGCVAWLRDQQGCRSLKLATL